MNKVISREVIIGSGAPAGTVFLTSIAFPSGEVMPGDPIGMRHADGGANIRMQSHVTSLHGDGSVMTARVAIEAPSVVDGERIAVEVTRGGEPQTRSFPVAPRDVMVEIRNTDGATFTWQPMASPVSDPWFDGALCLSWRASIKIPATVAGKESARANVDIYVTADGAIDLDIDVANDAFFQPDGGRANIGFRVLIDGAEALNIAPRGMQQYAHWIFWTSRRLDGLTVRRPILAPNSDRIGLAGVSCAVDQSQNYTSWTADSKFRPGPRSLATDVRPPLMAMWNAGQARDAEPGYTWGYNPSVGAVGGRPEIGFRSSPQMYFQATGEWEAYELMMRHARVGAARGFALFDPDTGTWFDNTKWSRFTGSRTFTAPLGSDPKAARSFPPGQGYAWQTGDGIGLEFDNAHGGSHFAMPAFFSARRVWYDMLAAQAAYDVGHQSYRFDGATLDTNAWTGMVPDHVTGRAWGLAPARLPQIRGYANSLRDIADASGLLPEIYPNRRWFDRSLQAFCAPWTVLKPLLESDAGQGETATRPWSDNGFTTNYMTSFLINVLLIAAKKTRPGFDVVRQAAQDIMRHRIEAFRSPDFNWRMMANGSFTPCLALDGTFLNTWKAVQAYANGHKDSKPTSPGWPEQNGLGDYQRLVMTTFMLAQDADWMDTELRAGAADGLVLYRSERTSPKSTTQPSILPTFYHSSWATPNTFVGRPGMSWRFDRAPVIRAGQVFTTDAVADIGDILGVLEWDGAIPRGSAPEAADAFVLVSQPTDGEVAITRGGGVRVVRPHPLGRYDFEVYATCWGGPLDGQSGPETRGPTVTVALQIGAPVVVVPPIDPPVDPPIEPPIDPPIDPPVDPPVNPPVDPPSSRLAIISAKAGPGPIHWSIVDGAPIGIMALNHGCGEPTASVTIRIVHPGD